MKSSSRHNGNYIFMFFFLVSSLAILGLEMTHQFYMVRNYGVHFQEEQVKIVSKV